MKGYKTSKDYKRLKELLDKGYEIICLGSYRACRACGLVRLDYYSGLYLLGGSWDMEFAPEDFEEECKENHIEFIEPNEEE